MLPRALLEARDARYFLKRYTDRIDARLRTDPAADRLGLTDAETLVRHLLERVDPTAPDGRYTEWILQRWLRRDIPSAEDFGRVRQALEIFHRRKASLPPAQRDVNRLRSLRDLETLVASLGDSPGERRRRIRGLADADRWNWVCRRPDHGVVVPRSHAESCAIAAYPRSRWCTAVRDDPETFEDYASRGRLYIIVVPGNVRSADEIRELYQFHPEDFQFMNREDEPVSLVSAWERFPCFREALSSLEGIRDLRDLVGRGPLSLADLIEIYTDRPDLLRPALAGFLHGAFEPDEDLAALFDAFFNAFGEPAICAAVRALPERVLTDYVSKQGPFLREKYAWYPALMGCMIRHRPDVMRALLRGDPYDAATCLLDAEVFHTEPDAWWSALKAFLAAFGPDEPETAEALASTLDGYFDPNDVRAILRRLNAHRQTRKLARAVRAHLDDIF